MSARPPQQENDNLQGPEGWRFFKRNDADRQEVKRQKILPRTLLKLASIFLMRLDFIGQERLGVGAKPQVKIYLDLIFNYS